MKQTEVNKNLPRDGVGLPANATPRQRIEHHAFVESTLRNQRGIARREKPQPKKSEPAA